MKQPNENPEDLKKAIANIQGEAARQAFNQREPADPETPGRCPQCGSSIRLKDNFCSNCGARNTWRDRKYRKVCGNCGAKVTEGDKYCRICGTLVGNGAFVPQMSMTGNRLYGPRPIPRRHVCENCGHQWTTSLMVDKEAYCPNCGGPAPIVEEIRPGRLGV